MIDFLGIEITFKAVAGLCGLWIVVLGLWISNLRKTNDRVQDINLKINGSNEATKYISQKKTPKTKYGNFYKNNLSKLFKEDTLLSKIAKMLVPNTSDVERKLILVKSDMSVEEFVSIKVLALVVGTLLSMCSILFGLNKIVLIIGILAIFIGLALENQIFGDKIKKRTIEIERDLPNFLDLLYSSCKTGHTITEAIKKVSTKYIGTVADEFNEAMVEFKGNGGDFKEAMENMMERNNIESLTNVLSDILISYEKGDEQIVDTIKEEAEVMREIVNAEIDEQANKKSTSLMLPMMAFFFFPLMLFLLLPLLSQFTALMG